MKVNLEQFANGALQEKFDMAFQRVIENMQDPNTPYKNKRVISIKIALTQNENRDDSAVEVSVETKLAPVMPIATRMSIGKDLRTGEIYAEEYGKQIKGQMSLSDMEESAPLTAVGEDVVDTDTGEVVGKVTDFRRKEA